MADTAISSRLPMWSGREPGWKNWSGWSKFTSQHFRRFKNPFAKPSIPRRFNSRSAANSSRRCSRPVTLNLSLRQDFMCPPWICPPLYNRLRNAGGRIFGKNWNLSPASRLIRASLEGYTSPEFFHPRHPRDLRRRTNMKGQTIILAGGSGGLGAAVAESLAERSAIPVIGCRSNRERAEALARALFDKYGVAAPVIVGDILDGSVRQQLLDAGRRAGPLYGLVPLAGQPARIPIESATEQDLIESMRTNFIGPILLARDFAAVMSDRDAAIVFISTM